MISEVKTCIEEAKMNGRMIVGASNMITSETPRENVFAILKAISELRKIK